MTKFATAYLLWDQRVFTYFGLFSFLGWYSFWWTVLVISDQPMRLWLPGKFPGPSLPWLFWPRGFSSFCFFKDFIHLSSDRGEGREKERERNINVWLPLMSPRGSGPHNPGVCPDQELNWWPFGLQTSAQSTEPHQLGLNESSYFCSPQILSLPCRSCYLDDLQFLETVLLTMKHPPLRTRAHFIVFLLLATKEEAHFSMCWAQWNPNLVYINRGLN